MKEIRGKCYSSCNKVELLSYRNGCLIKSMAFKMLTVGVGSGKKKGVRTMKLKADARSDIEGRRKKNLNKKGER